MYIRTGGGAIKLAQELRDNYGVSLNAISQPTDVTNPTGVFQQNIQFLFSNYDNVLRKQRAIAGIKYKLERGIWITRPPQGYDVIKINGVRSIKINEAGKLVKKAFEWKSQGVKSQDILLRLKASGLSMNKQQLSKIFKNPFYCGIITHGLLSGKLVESTHPAIISKELFLKVDEALIQNGQLGISHFKENNQLPLKGFMKCDMCQKPLTGYIVHRKNLYYYKCSTVGCKCNIRNEKVHKLFYAILEGFTLKHELIKPLELELTETFKHLAKENDGRKQGLAMRLAEIDKKLDTIEEKFYALNEMDAETFEKFKARYMSEKTTISQELQRSTNNFSNQEKGIHAAMTICSKLASLWDSATVSIKEKLQKLLLPEGIYYNRENSTLRTTAVNPIFELIAQLAGSFDKTKKGQTQSILDLSLLAGRTGLEPATSAVTGRHSNQLNYRPG